MPPFSYLAVLLLLLHCVSQFSCATVGNANANRMDEEDEEESSPSPPTETTEEIVSLKPVPLVRMPPSTNLKAEVKDSEAKPFSQNDPFYMGQVEIWPSKVNKPEHDILQAKAYCHDNNVKLFLEFGSPFSGYIYPYHHFKQCHVFSGRGETQIQLESVRNSCGADVIIGSDTTGNISFIEVAFLIQWEKEYITEFDRKMRITCNQQDNYRRSVDFNGSNPVIWMEVETESEDESADGESEVEPTYDPVVVGEKVDISFIVEGHSTGQTFDAQVVKCVVHDGLSAKLSSIEKYTVDSHSKFTYEANMTLLADGCPAMPTVFSQFQKTTKGSSVVLNNNFKVFRFPTSIFSFVVCDIRICLNECPPQQDCSSQLKTEPATASEDQKVVQLFRPLMVKFGSLGGLSPMDEHHVEKTASGPGISTASFIAGLIGMGFVCAIVLVFMYRRFKKGTEKDYKMQYNANSDKNKDEVAPLKVTSGTVAE